MVHVPLAIDRVDAVNHLVHTSSTQCGHIKHLRVATLEQAGTVSGRNNANLGREFAKVSWATAIHTDALVQDAITHNLLG